LRAPDKDCPLCCGDELCAECERRRLKAEFRSVFTREQEEMMMPKKEDD
jgi:hypothetical protein